MNRICQIKITGAFAIMFLLASCGSKTIPEPVVVEPDAVKTTSTEGSLWPGSNQKNTLFSDNKASQIGDIITVHLVEETIASNRASTKTDRQTKNKFGFSTGSGAPTAFEFGGGQKFGGYGDTSRKEKLTATISATVIEVLANGNLKIDGRKKMKINDADQYITVSGMVRPQDVTFDNTILSTKIANAEIVYDGVGELNKHQRGNWLGRTLNTIWPF